MQVFREARLNRPSASPYRNYVVGPFSSIFFPLPGATSAIDPVMQTLNQTRCTGATSSGTRSGRTRIRVINYAIYDTRGLWLSKKLRSLWNAGCDVRIIYSLATKPVLDILRHRSGRGPIPMKQSVIRNRRGQIVKYNHSKSMVITGNWGSSTGSWLSFSGSANWSNVAFSAPTSRCSRSTATAPARQYLRQLRPRPGGSGPRGGPAGTPRGPRGSRACPGRSRSEKVSTDYLGPVRWLGPRRSATSPWGWPTARNGACAVLDFGAHNACAIHFGACSRVAGTYMHFRQLAHFLARFTVLACLIALVGLGAERPGQVPQEAQLNPVAAAVRSPPANSPMWRGSYFSFPNAGKREQVQIRNRVLNMINSTWGAYTVTIPGTTCPPPPPPPADPVEPAPVEPAPVEPDVTCTPKPPRNETRRGSIRMTTWSFNDWGIRDALVRAKQPRRHRPGDRR